MRNLDFPASGLAGLLTPEPPEAADIRRAYAQKRAAQEARERHLALSDLVRTEIIPRLRLRHPTLEQVVPRPAPKLETETVAKFTAHILAQDPLPAFSTFSELLADGYAADDLFLDLLAPSAALLGRLWEEDLCDFIEVTAGAARLQLLLAAFRIDGATVATEEQRRVLLIGAPGEQHRFGIALVEQFLRKAGWEVTSGLDLEPQQIAALVQLQWFGVAGLTLSCETHVDLLTAVIQDVRRASRNRAIGIMVGGPVFLAKPELVAQVGADASAADAPTAVLLAQRLLDLAAQTIPPDAQPV
ncbi:cobalamin B12-binding domain-containing protein [Methylobacterium durans]|uniref:Coenzyme B12-binding protein n=1 Tax=Methylobacterium durans TaxID=2202825 RepID=A0A2U8W9M1_9HYPH|nr:cobalamin B12-binding domain-containing protein [Methylobacterium durans]AWN42308.1 coenzyme B12-binding protein [Methylobacterium durans]